MKQFEILKWGLLIIILFVLLRELNKLGLLGKTEEDKKADALGDSNALAAADVTNPIITKATITLPSGKVKTFKDMTAAERAALTPNSKKFSEWINELWDASGTFNDNEDDVYDVFRKLYSQYETSIFAATFKVLKGKDLYTYLKSFMNNDELAQVYDITSKKKKS